VYAHRDWSFTRWCCISRRPSSNTVALPQEVELMPQYQNFSFKAAVAI